MEYSGAGGKLLHEKNQKKKSLKEIEISRQSCRGDCEYQGGKFLRRCLNFVQEFGLSAGWDNENLIAGGIARSTECYSSRGW